MAGASFPHQVLVCRVPYCASFPPGVLGADNLRRADQGGMEAFSCRCMEDAGGGVRATPGPGGVRTNSGGSN
jgi:hypothetical protein